jgi:hypothetical protein
VTQVKTEANDGLVPFIFAQSIARDRRPPATLRKQALKLVKLQNSA